MPEHFWLNPIRVCLLLYSIFDYLVKICRVMGTICCVTLVWKETCRMGSVWPEDLFWWHLNDLLDLVDDTIGCGVDGSERLKKWCKIYGLLPLVQVGYGGNKKNLGSIFFLLHACESVAYLSKKVVKDYCNQQINKFPSKHQYIEVRLAYYRSFMSLNGNIVKVCLIDYVSCWI